MDTAEQKAKEIITSFYNILKRPEMRILPGQIAFYFLMSLVPIAAITSISVSYLFKNYDFLGTISTMLPPVFANIVTSLTNDLQLHAAIVVLIAYLFLGSNGPGGIVIASNVLYDTKQPGYLRRKFKSIVMTIMLVFLLLFIILIPLFGDSIVKGLIIVFNAQFLREYTIFYVIIKAILSFFVMYFIIKFLYTFAPSKKIDSSTTVKGSLFTTSSWILATYIFAYYISYISSYNIIYGNFANILILLLWLYILAYLFVFGMALNVEDFYDKRKWVYSDKKDEGKDKK